MGTEGCTLLYSPSLDKLEFTGVKTFSKSSFVLRVEALHNTVSLTGSFPSFSPLLITGINLIGCHRGTLVLVCVHWWNLKVPITFKKVGRVISCDFINFCSIELRNSFATDILFS